METGMSDKWMQISSHAPVEMYNVQSGKSYLEEESSELQKHWENLWNTTQASISDKKGSQDKQLHNQSALWPT